jgi:hypothetical protein
LIASGERDIERATPVADGIGGIDLSLRILRGTGIASRADTNSRPQGCIASCDHQVLSQACGLIY